jgi:hypothetical protein
MYLAPPVQSRGEADISLCHRKAKTAESGEIRDIVHFNGYINDFGASLLYCDRKLSEINIPVIIPPVLFPTIPCHMLAVAIDDNDTLVIVLPSAITSVPPSPKPSIPHQFLGSWFPGQDHHRHRHLAVFTSTLFLYYSPLYILPNSQSIARLHFLSSV